MLFKVSLNVIIAVWTNRNDQRHIKSWLCAEVHYELLVWRKPEAQVWDV